MEVGVRHPSSKRPADEVKDKPKKKNKKDKKKDTPSVAAPSLVASVQATTTEAGSEAAAVVGEPMEIGCPPPASERPVTEASDVELFCEEEYMTYGLFIEHVHILPATCPVLVA